MSFILLGLILILISWAVRPEDHYSRTFQAQELILNGGSTEVSEQDSYVGMVTSGPMISLPAGTYDITLRYEASEEGNFMQLWDAEQFGTMQIDGALPKEQSDHTVRVRYPAPVSDLEICTFYGGSGTFQIKSVTINCVEGQANTRDAVILPILVYITAILSYVLCRKLCVEDRKFILILGGVVLLASLPCYMNYLVAGHDMPFETARITGIASGLQSGQFPVRIHADTFSGHGYAVSVFYPELFLYIPALLYLSGVSLAGSVHVYLVFINALSAGIMYFSASRIFRSKEVGLYSAIIYTMAIYRLVLTYLMNGYGSAMAMVFIPLVIYGMYEILQADWKKYGYLVMGITGVLQSHILSFAIVIFFLVLVFIVSLFINRNWKRYFSLAKATGLTVLINLWFLVPFLQYYFSDLDKAALAGAPASRALSVSNLFSVWAHLGFGIQYVNTPATGVPVALDLVILIGIILFLADLVREAKQDGSEKDFGTHRAFVLLAVGLLAIYMTTKYFPWLRIQNHNGLSGVVAFLQHPQRLLCVGVPCLTMVAGYGYDRLHIQKQNMTVILLGLCILPSMMFLQEYSTQDIKCAKGEILSTNVGTAEYLYPDTNTEGLITGQYEINGGDIYINEFEKHGTHLSFYCEADEDGNVTLPLFYYEGYQAKWNGQSYKLYRGDNNRIAISVAQGQKGVVTVMYKEPMIWRVADIISVGSILCIMVLYAIRKKRMIKI